MSFNKTGDAQPITVVYKCSKCGRQISKNEDSLCPDCFNEEQQLISKNENNDA